MSWNKILVTGFAASLAIVGCTVTTSSDQPDGGGGSDAGKGTGGSTSTGGSTAGGATSTGGAKTTGGSTSAGGASAGGATSEDAGPESDCTKCLKQFCLTDYTDCGKDPDCAQSSKADGEFLKIQQCLFDVTPADASTVYLTAADLEKCVGDSANGAVASTATQSLLSCARGELDASLSKQPCTERCFGGPINP
ncbi:MAG TPA: hypothetical protein VF395_09115 [Polyangiaceae bacterium]